MILLKNIAIVAAGLALAGCVTSEVRPLEKVNPIQAQQQIPEAELLDVGVRLFDPNVPQDIKDDEEALAKKRIFPEVRRAEASYFATRLRATLESSGQWGAVRVVPEQAIVDVVVSARILESTGQELAFEVTAVDAMGRTWIAGKRYDGVADIGSYKTEAALKARDPFQNVFSQVANDLLAARQKLTATDLRDLRRVSELRFAQQFAPEALASYLATDGKGVTRAVRLPAEGDPVMERVGRIRERDEALVDTVNGYHANFAEKMQDSYGNFRRVSYEEIEKEDRARASARTRTALGAAAVLASILVADQCGPSDYTCRNVQSAARTAGAVGGVAAVMSGIKKYSDAKVHAQALQELANTFEAEMAPQVVEVEGRTLKLTGTAEQQYREWRELLRQLYREDMGEAAASPPAAAPPTPPPSPTASR